MIPNTLPKSLVDNPNLDQWLAFRDGRVRLSTGKVELGQGALTALAQIAAEELDVDFARIDVVSGETPFTPNEGYTAGSASIEVAGSSIRLASAEARALFTARAAVELNGEAGDISVQDGRFYLNGSPTGLDYWSLAHKVHLGRPVTGAAPVKDPRRHTIVGKSVPRLDLPAKMTGAAFIHDIAIDGMLHGRMVRRPWKDARCGQLDQGVIERFSSDVDVVRDGDLIAVLSFSETLAMACADALTAKARWEGGEPVPDRADDVSWLRSLNTVERETGNGRATPGHAARTLTADYWRPYLAHASIAPSCAIARLDGGRLAVYTHSQGIFMLRASLAKALRMDAASIDLFHRQSAGCYGHNGADDVAFDAAWLATKRPGVPIRVQWSRADEFAAAPVSSAMAVRLEAGLDKGSKVAGWRIDVWSGPHGQRPGMSGGVNLLGAEALQDALPAVTPVDVPDEMGGGALRNAIALYEVPQKVVSHFIPSMPVRTSSFRGLGALGNVFAIECFVDELADVAGEDPVAYRLSLLGDARARRVIESAAKLAGWTPQPEGTGRAKGIAFSRYKNHAAYLAAVVEVSVAEAVSIEKVWCAVDAGLVVNPDGLRNQIEGGIVQAASWVLHEEVRFAEGRISSSSWEHYPILRFSEIPDVEIELVGDPSAPALGVGEVALGPTAAAIGNAVASALGTRIRRLPFSRDRLTSALLAAG